MRNITNSTATSTITLTTAHSSRRLPPVVAEQAAASQNGDEEIEVILGRCPAVDEDNGPTGGDEKIPAGGSVSLEREDASVTVLFASASNPAPPSRPALPP